MFKDTDQELARLEAELLKEEAPETEALEEDCFDETEEEMLPPEKLLYRSGGRRHSYGLPAAIRAVRMYRNRLAPQELACRRQAFTLSRFL